MVYALSVSQNNDSEDLSICNKYEALCNYQWKIHTLYNVETSQYQTKTYKMLQYMRQPELTKCFHVLRINWWFEVCQNIKFWKHRKLKTQEN